MNNNLNSTFCWDAISQKLLICKDDQSIDVGWLKTLTSNQIVTEIIVENDDFHPILSEMIHYEIVAGYFYRHNKYRIFQVEHIDSKIKQQPYFVSILEFDQKKFEDLILCNHLLDMVLDIQEETEMHFGEYLISLDCSQMAKSTKDLFSPLEDQIRSRIKKHMSA